MNESPLTDEQLRVLMSPLSRSRVQSRSQGGRSLSYLAAWDIKATLIRVFGFGGFSADVTESSILRMERDVPAFTGTGKERKRKVDADGNPDFNWSITAMVTMRLYIKQMGVTYTETAIASQTGPDVGEVADFAVKTAESDALKRAAINLGTTFGLGLYDNGSTNEVIRRIFAPGQEWPKEDPKAKAASDLALQQSLGQKIDAVQQSLGPKTVESPPDLSGEHNEESGT